MTDVVRDRWLEFTELWEGGVACLYADRRGIPTIAYGNAVFTASDAAALPLMHPGGVPATTAEKVAIWAKLDGNVMAAEAGWKHAAKLSDLRLTREGMVTMALAKYDTNDRILRARCPDWDTLPTCARCALHSLAWACGANAHYPRLFQDVANRDFEAAAVEIHINEYTPEGIHNVGVIPRNVANKILMRNAARVDAFKLDPDLLNWHDVLGVSDAETVPALDNPDSEPLPLLVTPLPTSAATYPTLHPLRYDRGPDDPPDDPSAA